MTTPSWGPAFTYASTGRSRLVFSTGAVSSSTCGSAFASTKVTGACSNCRRASFSSTGGSLAAFTTGRATSSTDFRTTGQAIAGTGSTTFGRPAAGTTARGVCAFISTNSLCAAAAANCGCGGSDLIPATCRPAGTTSHANAGLFTSGRGDCVSYSQAVPGRDLNKES